MLSGRRRANGSRTEGNWSDRFLGRRERLRITRANLKNGRFRCESLSSFGRVWRMKSPNRICTYCGLHQGTTRDHVPPKGLFARPRPELVTVPCCEACRKAQPLDDEYFVRMVSMKSGLHETDSSRNARNAALRSLTKPTKQRFTH